MPDPARAGDAPVSDVADTPFNGNFGDEDRASTADAYLIDKASEVQNGAAGTSASKPPMVDLPPVQPTAPANDAQLPLPTPTPAPEPTASPTSDNQSSPTLEAIEESVKSPHVDSAADSSKQDTTHAARLDDARQQVQDALKEGSQPLEPIASLNAQPLGAPLTHGDSAAAANPPVAASTDEPAKPVSIEVDNEGNLTTIAPPSPAPTAQSPAGIPLPPVPDSSKVASNAPPPVPPPMMPPSFGS